MSESAIQGHVGAVKTESAPGHRDRGLLLIGLFKLGKSIFFFAVGLGAIHLLHENIGNVAMNVAAALKFDPEGRFVGVLMQKIDLIDVKHLRDAGLLSLGYSALAMVEGVGLMLEKVWAEYLTLGLTISFLPWEMFELARKPGLVRLGLLLANLAVLAYILWLLRRKRVLTQT